MVSFELSDEQRMLRDLARDFARSAVAPVAAHYDETAEFPRELIDQGREIGLLNSTIPEEYGGSGLSVFEDCLVTEEIAWGCSGVGTIFGGPNMGETPVLGARSAEQKLECLGREVDDRQIGCYGLSEPEAGSDVAGIQTSATRHGDTYVLNGAKTFISNAGVADIFVIFAVTDKSNPHHGMTAFILERGMPGLSIGRKFDKMGQRCADTSEVIMNDVEAPVSCRLGAENAGFQLAMRTFDRTRVPTAAGAVGVAQRALDEATKYAKERKTFGKPIGQYQGISFMLADMAMNIEAGRLLTWQASLMVDAGAPSNKHSAFAKAFAADMAMQVTVDAVQVHGGYGYMKEFPVEKLMRDVKIYQIYEGTSQIQRIIIGRELLRN